MRFALVLLLLVAGCEPEPKPDTRFADSTRDLGAAMVSLNNTITEVVSVKSIPAKCEEVEK